MPAGEEGEEEEEEEEDDDGKGDGPDASCGYAPLAFPKVHQFCVGFLYWGVGRPKRWLAVVGQTSTHSSAT